MGCCTVGTIVDGTIYRWDDCPWVDIPLGRLSMEQYTVGTTPDGTIYRWHDSRYTVGTIVDGVILILLKRLPIRRPGWTRLSLQILWFMDSLVAALLTASSSGDA